MDDSQEKEQKMEKVNGRHAKCPRPVATNHRVRSQQTKEDEPRSLPYLQ